MVVPVIYDACEESRNATTAAISSGWPNRPRALIERMSASNGTSASAAAELRYHRADQFMGLRRVGDVAREGRCGPPVFAEFADERVGGGPIGSIVDRDGGSLGGEAPRDRGADSAAGLRRPGPACRPGLMWTSWCYLFALIRYLSDLRVQNSWVGAAELLDGRVAPPPLCRSRSQTCGPPTFGWRYHPVSTPPPSP